MAYLAELDALQRWLFSTTGLTSLRLVTAAPKLARPVAIFEAPYVGRDRNLNRYLYVKRTQQYGKLYVSNLEELANYQERLIEDLEEKVGVLPMYNAQDVVIGHLKEVSLEFNRSDNLDVPFTITYEATYSRIRPPTAPPASSVITRTTINSWK